MSEKDAIIRQRLIELEKKHAKALRKLQRAEKSKERRQTFHGFTVQDENTGSRETQNSSSILLSQEMFSPDVRKSSCLSTHKKRLCKTVTFQETCDNHQQPLSQKKCNEGNESSGSSKTPRRFSSVGSCISKNEPELELKTLQHDVENHNKGYDTPDKNVLKLPSDSLVLSDNETILHGNVVIADKQDCLQVQHVEHQGMENGLGEDVPKLPACSKEISDLVHHRDIYFTNSESGCTATSEETVYKDRNSTDHSSKDIITENRLGLSKDTAVTLNEKDCLVQKEETDNSTPVREGDNSPSENWHWLRLFEEEFPRRSPRLRSTPNFKTQGVVSPDNNLTQLRKTKLARTKNSKTKKEITPSSGVKPLRSDVDSTNLHESLSKGRTSEDFVFPRPSLQQTRNGGPLSVVVDFSLPDKEFVKLKLAKIKSALSTERTNREVLVNNITERTTEKSVSEMEGDSKLAGSTWTNTEEKGRFEKAMEQHVGRTEGDSKLPDAKCGEETKECLTHTSSSSQACFVELDSDIKSEEVETSSSANSLSVDRIRTENGTGLSSAETLKCTKRSECAGSNSPVSVKRQQCDVQVQDMAAKNSKANISSKQQAQEDTGFQTCTLCCMELCTCSTFEIFNDASLTHDVWQGNDNKKFSPDDHERHLPCSESNRLDNQGGFVNNERFSHQNAPIENSTADIEKKIVNEFPNQRDTNDEAPKTGVMQEVCGPTFSPDSVTNGISRSLNQQNDQGELFDITQGKCSPPHSEPSVGEQATPHGKMKEPLESSQVSCMMSPEEHSELSPVIMMACLQHHIEGEDNKVRSVSLSSYEPSTEMDVSQLQKKRDVLAICLPHLVVIWTVVPGLQWTVLHKWSLPLDGAEEFVSVQFVPLKSHVALLVGGNFCNGNGRILGYSEEGDYSLDLLVDDERNKHFFSTMCLLQDTLECKVDRDVEFIIGDRALNKVTLTKWSLDGCCLLVEGFQTFTPVCSDSELSSLKPVHDSHCLVLGTTDDELFLWNHKTCQQLRSISLHTMGVGSLSCLKAFTQRGLLFLMMASNSAQGRNCVDTNADACLLYALNPKTSETICLERFRLPGRFNTVDTNGQYIAAGGHGIGEVNMWNITNSQRHATLQVFQDEVSSIGFHQGRSLIAFGSASGCVHLFSLG